MMEQQQGIILVVPNQRSPIEIDMDVLQACHTPQRTTKIMLITRLNHSTLKNRLSKLEEVGVLSSRQLFKQNGCLIPKIPIPIKGRIFLITQKGTELLNSYAKFLALYRCISGFEELPR